MPPISRRSFLAVAAGAGAGSLLLGPWRRLGEAGGVADPVARLLAGNRRFVAGRLTHPNQSPQRRTHLAGGQRPFAAILSCADSRVPPEVVFDEGLGDLFVVRVAGNIADPPAVGSLEYAVTALEVPLVMVLGHSRCGAVDAALKTPPGAPLSPGLASLVEAIRPAAQEARDRPGDMLANAVRANVARVVGQLRRSQPTLGTLAGEGKIRIVGAHYDLETGAVELLG